MNKIYGNSHVIESNQKEIHKDLEAYLAKYSLTNYQRPVASFSKELWEEILGFCQGKSIIFDLGCGIGESSYNLAKIYPDSYIVGIDKSISRLERKNDFKESENERVKLYRGELLDIIPLIYSAYSEAKIDIRMIFVLYPNPWPKKHHIKRRFYASPVSVFLFNTHVPIVFRSNWKLYLEETEAAALFFKRKNQGVESLNLSEFITPFERKYSQSGQSIYELKIL